MSEETTKNTNIDWLNAVKSSPKKIGSNRRRVIRITRVLLILTVVIILAAVFYSLKDDEQVVPNLKDIGIEDVPVSVVKKEKNVAKGEIAMIKAKYSGLDEMGRAFNITANKASRSSDTPDMINLQKPMADVLLKDGSWVAVYGEQGTYMQQHMQLFLNNNVRLFHDSGYEMITDSLHIDLKHSLMRSESDVVGHGAFGKIDAKGLEFVSEKDILIFTGPAKLTLFLENNILGD